MSKEELTPNQRINRTAIEKRDNWRGREAGLREIIHRSRVARAGRNVAALLSVPIASYFGYTIANNEAVATDTMLGLLTAVGIGVAVMSEDQRRAREAQIPGATHDTAAAARDLLEYVDQNTVPIDDGFRQEIIEGTRLDATQQAAAQQPNPGS